MSINVDQLTKKFGKKTILDNISFEIGKGEIVGLLGINGAGKTTTMRILTGVIPYQVGKVRIDQMEVAKYPLQTKQRIGYLPEQNPLYNNMYIIEYLSFVANLFQIKNKKQTIDTLVQQVGLKEVLHNKLGKLSKGYRQRVGIAQALLNDPSVLILDEPTTGLDPQQIIEIRDLIKLLGKNKTILFSTHILQEAAALCQRILILHRGKIIANLPNGQYNTTRYKVEFLHAVPQSQIAQIAAYEIIDGSENHSFILKSEKDIRADLFDFAVSHNNKILTLQPLEKQLEEVFTTLIKQQ